jgi:hypothetical protein
MVEPGSNTFCAQQTEFRLLAHRIHLAYSSFHRRTPLGAEYPAVEMPRRWVSGSTLNLRREFGSSTSQAIRTGSPSGHIAREIL